MPFENVPCDSAFYSRVGTLASVHLGDVTLSHSEALGELAEATMTQAFLAFIRC